MHTQGMRAIDGRLQLYLTAGTEASRSRIASYGLLHAVNTYSLGQWLTLASRLHVCFGTTDLERSLTICGDYLQDFPGATSPKENRIAGTWPIMTNGKMSR